MAKNFVGKQFLVASGGHLHSYKKKLNEPRECLFKEMLSSGADTENRNWGANEIRGHITRACWAAQLAFKWKS